IVVSGEFQDTDPLLSDTRLDEARDMAKLYPLFYILENSIREFIRRVIDGTHGKSWWDTEAPRKIRDRIQERMADDQKHAWHQRRGSHPIDYLDLNQLPDLVRKTQGDFISDLLPSLEWFTQFVDEVYQSRCVVCHMNPLDKDNIQAVKVRLRQWQKLVSEKKSQLP
ncbi:MAG: Swt1 family HEPN domain-containing protein, partial [Nitrospinota bacterium]